MGHSTLINTGEKAPEVNKGHGTDALGPSDSSDSGSDTTGGPGLSGEIDLPLDTGTTSDPDTGKLRGTAGPDVGDANLDSDSDREGTGERATAGRDTYIPDNADIRPDNVEDFDIVSDETDESEQEDQS
jgi:hypothetical protein